MKLGDIINETDVEDLGDLINAFADQVPYVINKFHSENAVFKAQIVESGRITVPTAERKSLGLEEGDIVQIYLRKVEKKE